MAVRAAATGRRRENPCRSTTMPEPDDREAEEEFYDAYTELLVAEEIDILDALIDECA